MTIATPFQDLREGAKRWRLGFMLSWNDTVLPLRRSYLGAAWATLQIALLVLIIYLLFGDLRGAGMTDYALYVAAGVTAFQMMMVGLVDGANGFRNQANLIKNFPHPHSLYVFRLFYKMLITFAFAAPVWAGAMWYSGVTLSFALLPLAFAGALLLAVAWTGVALLMACVTVLVQDVLLAVQACSRLLFFMTPIFWVAESRGGVRGMLSTYNPLSYFLTVVREPLRGNMPALHDYLVCAAFLIAAWTLGILVFSLVRPRIAALV